MASSARDQFCLCLGGSTESSWFLTPMAPSMWMANSWPRRLNNSDLGTSWQVMPEMAPGSTCARSQQERQDWIVHPGG